MLRRSRARRGQYQMHREGRRFVLCQKHGQLARRDRRRGRIEIGRGGRPGAATNRHSSVSALSRSMMQSCSRRTADGGDAEFSGLRESRADGRPCEARARDFAAGQCRKSPAAHAVRQRCRSAHRGEERIRGAGARPLARPRRLDRRHGRVTTMGALGVEDIEHV